MRAELPPRVGFRSTWPLVGGVFIISAALIGVVLLLHFWKDIPFGTLTGDPAAIGGDPLYTGFLSQVGLFFWSAAAAVSLFSAAVLSPHPDAVELRRFLLASGLLTLVLGLDDAFLLHEGLFPYFGVPEILVYATYAGAVLFYLTRFASTIRRTEYVLLGTALLFFGISVALDLLEPPGIDRFLLEDGAKLVGIVSWLAYFASAAAAAVQHGAARQAAIPHA